MEKYGDWLSVEHVRAAEHILEKQGQFYLDMESTTNQLLFAIAHTLLAIAKEDK